MSYQQNKQLILGWPRLVNTLIYFIAFTALLCKYAIEIKKISFYNCVDFIM